MNKIEKSKKKYKEIKMTTSKRFIAILILCLLGFFLGQTLFCETLAEPPSNFHDPDVGARENPFLISNLANLRWLSETPDVWRPMIYWDADLGDYVTERFHFLQTADIDATETMNWNQGRGFEPIGNSRNTFYGWYNGNYFKISNLYIYDPNNTHLGFIGLGRWLTIENIRLEDVNIITTGEVDGSRQYVGALVAEIDGNSSLIIRSSTTGDISILREQGNVQIYVGGIVGQAFYAVISGTYSMVNIYVDSIPNNRVMVGGLVGRSTGPPSITLAFSYFYGSIICVNQNSQVAGIIGSGYMSYILYCYVTSTKPFSHGAGMAHGLSGSYFYPNFWDIEATGASIGINSIDSTNYIDIQGLTTAEMKDYAFYKDAGWDFVDVWFIDPEINDGYPYLRNYPPPVVSNYENPIKPLINSIVYPNPVRGVDVTIKWYAPPSPPHSASYMGGAELIIYNIRGQLVKRSSDFETRDGENVFVWDRRNEMGQEVASGVYFYQINTIPEKEKTSSRNLGFRTGRFVLIK